MISMKYTIDTLREINARFCGSHILMNYDVDKANIYVKLIENTRSEKTPSVGDCVRYTNEYGDYYEADRYYKSFSAVHDYGDGWKQPD